MELDASRSPSERLSVQIKAGGAKGLKYTYHLERLYVFPECVLKFEPVDRELMVCLQASFPVDILFGLSL